MGIQDTLQKMRALLRRKAGGPALLAALLLGLLLVQPALCLIHCSATAHAAPGQQAASDQQHLLCSLADGETAPSAYVLVLVFWPSLPIILASAMLAFALLHALPAQGTALISLAWSPAPPPPRPR